ncbi:MAG: DUF362 domain-containing protein [Candidatus Aminicenantes bacterium]|jgi:uncharacterized protein (DUF362 family)|nr:DUF362 domain-containing protein [Candidatus Aminicenantes bacterium]MDH5386237.1 DUF362 domain-containing protein [Candidatus Aminicenantes bacterium]MDH5743631.1 DUF362 domain-containing protein [Candidatus Aminicenantes bacterium]
MDKKIGRREFFKKSAQVGFSTALGFGLASLMEGKVTLSGDENVDIAVVTGSDYYASTIKAVECLGGMKNFVSKDAKVAILPNSQSKHPGTFTKPEVVQAVIKMCKEAGATEVNCLTWLQKENWDASGLAAAVEEAGATMRFVESEEANFKSTPVPGWKAHEEAMIMKEFYNNDVFIDMPITKDHAGNKFTGTLKNLMGLNYRPNNRLFHRQDWQTNPESIQHLDQCIVDLNKVVKPTLCVVDATEFITTNGPFGPGEFAKPQKIVAGKDRVAIDAYCTTLWGLKGEDIYMIKLGSEQGLGEIDLKKVKIKEIKA